MKRFFIGLLVLVSVLMGIWYFYGQAVPAEAERPSPLAVDTCTFDLGAGGGSRMIVELAEEEAWCAAVNGGEGCDWVSLLIKNTEEGNSSLVVDVTANSLEEKRNAYVKVVYGEKLRVLLIEQEGCDGKNK